MSEQAPGEEHEFHPAVEDIMHTSGPDIGRVKDVDAAKAMAHVENAMRDQGNSREDYLQDPIEAENKIQVGIKAAELEMRDGLHRELAREAAHSPGASFIGDMEKNLVEDGRKQAAAAVESYDQFQKDTPKIRAEENLRLQTELEEARRKITES